MGGAQGWDYLTEENAEPLIRLLPEAQIVLFRDRVFEMLGQTRLRPGATRLPTLW
jgi:hypothetical protein